MLQNTKEIINQGITKLQRKSRADFCKIVEQVLKDIDPYQLMLENLALKKNILTIAKKFKIDLSHYQNIYIVGAGKAVYKMALAAEEVLGERIKKGCINIPSAPTYNQLKKVIFCIARHPVPDLNGVRGTKKIVELAQNATAQDLVIALISGGGSALMPLPAVGITLKQKIDLTKLLLKTPATIHEINTVRKHLSQIKGGQLASLFFPATVVGIYISDIVGDDFDVQASGPTAPDSSTFADAIRILKKYSVWMRAAQSIRTRLTRGAQGLISETPKSTDQAFKNNRVHNFTIGNHNTAVQSAVRAGKKLGYHAFALTSSMQGEAREIAKMIVRVGENIIKNKKPVRVPALVVAGGETTVTIYGHGKGGRNQELALAGFLYLQDSMTLASFGTDGVDGMTPVPVAGAIVDSATYVYANQKNLDFKKFLLNNDSYPFFKAVGGHLITGPTGTNVGDLVLLAVY